MGQYNQIVITDAGLALLASAQLESGAVTFTEIRTGNGEYDGMETLKSFTDLKSQKNTFTVNSVSYESDTKLKIRCELINSDVPIGYDITEIGIFGKLANGSDTLIGITTAVEADFFPATDVAPCSIMLELYVEVTDCSDVKFEYTMPEGVYELAKDAAEKYDALQKGIDSKVDADKAAETYAPKDSPVFTGKPTAPTPDSTSNDTQVATTAFVKALINALINGAPATMDTLKEVADAIANNDDVVAALNAAIGNKANANGSNASGTWNGKAKGVDGVLPVENGGTGKSTLADAANEFINSLSAGDSVPQDTDCYVSQYVNGDALGVKTYHRRPLSRLWEYIQSKISSILGLTASSYGGNAATATNASKVNNYTVNANVPSDAKFTDTVITVDSSLSSTSTNPLQNKEIYSSISKRALINEPAFTGSISMGRKSGTTVGTSSVAVGYQVIASGNHSHAEGYYTNAMTEDSHAEGYYTETGGLMGSHAEGCHTKASGSYAHAEGHYTTADGSASHAEGTQTMSLGNQHAQGHHNNTSTAIAGAYEGTGTGTAFVIGNGTSSSKSNAFRVNYNGQAYSSNTSIATGADYAEYFEWADQNSISEDRVGLFVTFDEENPEMIRIANEDDYILGIVSGMPSVIGNGDECWKQRYILDDFGRYIEETFEYETEEIDKETGEKITVTKTGTKWKENPDYDQTKPYAQRSERPEWSAVGMVGVLSVYDDGTCKVNGYCKCSKDGIATASETGYRVIKRVTDNIVKVVLK